MDICNLDDRLNFCAWPLAFSIKCACLIKLRTLLKQSNISQYVPNKFMCYIHHHYLYVIKGDTYSESKSFYFF